MSDLGIKIRKTMVQAICDYNMIEEGDRILCAVSGGKDSTVMLLKLLEIQKKARIPFSVQGLLINQKQPWFDPAFYLSWLKEKGVAIAIIEENIYPVVLEKTPEGKSKCRICSRLRRGALYTYAYKNGYTKIALGHHRDDLNETVLLNMFFSGNMASMPPKLTSDDGRNTVIRPMCYIPETSILTYSKEMAIPVVNCSSCESYENMQRMKMKTLLRDFEERYPGVGSSILRSLKNVKPSQLLDKELWDFDA